MSKNSFRARVNLTKPFICELQSCDFCYYRRHLGISLISIKDTVCVTLKDVKILHLKIVHLRQISKVNTAN